MFLIYFDSTQMHLRTKYTVPQYLRARLLPEFPYRLCLRFILLLVCTLMSILKDNQTYILTNPLLSHQVSATYRSHRALLHTGASLRRTSVLRNLQTFLSALLPIP